MCQFFDIRSSLANTRAETGAGEPEPVVGISAPTRSEADAHFRDSEKLIVKAGTEARAGARSEEEDSCKNINFDSTRYFSGPQMLFTR